MRKSARAAFLLIAYVLVMHSEPFVLRAFGQSAKKAGSTQNVLRIVSKIEAVARRHRNQRLDPATRNRLSALVRQLNKSEELTKLGLITGTIAYPQEAGDESYDVVFEHAMWECAAALSRRSDVDAVAGLQKMKEAFGTDGMPARLFEELIKAQERGRGINP